MIVKIFSKHGNGQASSCKACVDYLLNKPNDTAKILQGDPRLSQDIADSLQFTNTYTAGCLSFEEPDLPEESKRAIMAEFEKSMFAGLEQEQYNISWVQHTDKGRLELNFVIPNVELTSGKRLQPYYDRADRPLAENFKQVINHEYQLTDPNDPTKKQAMVTKQELPKERKQALEAITEGITNLAQAGQIKDRQDVITALESAGFEIARITPKNISIKTEGQNLRLKGAIYEQDFRFSENLSADIAERAREYKRNGRERYQVAREKLARAVEKRKQEFSRKYPNRAEEIDQKHSQNVPLADHNRTINYDDNNRHISRLDVDSQRELSRYAEMAKISRNSPETIGGNTIDDLLDSTGREQGLRGNRRGLHQSTLGRQGQSNDNQSLRQQGEINGDRNRNIFRESIERLVSSTRERAKDFISRVREITQRKRIDPTTIQRNQRTITNLNELNRSLTQVIEQKQAQKAQERNSRGRGFSMF